MQASPLLAQGYGVYPAPPPTNYDFVRGALTDVHVYNEAGQLQQHDQYEYGFTGPQVQSVEALDYDRAGTSTFQYGKYTQLTNFLFALTRSSQQTNGQSGGSLTQTQFTRYNSNGEVAATITVDNDGRHHRRRFKYLADYSFPASSYGPNLQAMEHRRNSERISGVIETVDEIKNGNEHWVIGATFTTLRRQGNATRVYQSWQWTPAQPVAYGAYDSTRIRAGANGVLDLLPGRLLRVSSSVEEANDKLTPTSVVNRAGRATHGTHFGYGGRIPVLEINNALASEVRFSDFESAKEHQFDAITPSAITAAAARTGTKGYLLSSSATLQTMVPGHAGSPASYRFSAWVKSSAPTTLGVTVTAGGSPAGVPALTLSVTGNNNWQLLEAELDFSSLNTARGNALITVSANNQVQADDVLLLPTQARAQSSTYDVTKGKTSDTDARGYTTFYEYDRSYNLRLVRDHNGDIVRQNVRSTPGAASLEGVRIHVETFQPTYDNEVVFIANTCAEGAEFTWDFGDGSTVVTRNARVTHTYQYTPPRQLNFNVQVVMRAGNKQYLATHLMPIGRERLKIEVERIGVIGYDNCGQNQPTRDFPNGITPQNGFTDFEATVVNTISCVGSPFSYQWYEIDPLAGNPFGSPINPARTDVVGANTNRLSFKEPVRRGRSYYCVVTGCDNEGESLQESVLYYSSQDNCTLQNPN